MLNYIIKSIISDPLMRLFFAMIFIEIVALIIWICKSIVIILIVKILLKISKFHDDIGSKVKYYHLFDTITSFAGSKIYYKFNFILSVLITFVTCMISIRFVYQVIRFFINIVISGVNFSDDICSYLSLTLLLVCIAYYPEKIVFIIQNGVNRIGNRKPSKLCLSKEVNKYNDDLEVYKKFVIFLRPKLWMYLISIFITIFNSLEKISSTPILNYPLWLQIKPIVFESVFSMIVIDTFINLFKTECRKIKEEAIEIVNSNKNS